MSPHLVGWMLAAAVDAGNDEVFGLLLASTDGSDEVATMGRHVPIALLCAERPDGWECIERLLLSAQRQEGLRQSILEVADEARPEALRRMLALILEHGLSRFASVARAAAVWLGLELFAGRAAQARRARSSPRSRSWAIRMRAGPRPAPARRSTSTSHCGRPATEDVHAAIETAASVLRHARRRVPLQRGRLLSQTRVDAAAAGLLQALDDEDLRVAATAVAPLNQLAPGRRCRSPTTRSNSCWTRIPKRAVELDAVEWFGPLSALKREDVGRLLLRHRDPPDVDRVLPRRAVLETWDVARLVERLGEGPLTADRRAALLEALGDASADVREQAIAAAAQVEISDEEALALEPLLRRKPGDLRRGVIELILARGDAWALDAAGRLLSGGAQERLGGVELLRRLAAGGSEIAAARGWPSSSASEGDSVVEEATRRALGDNALTAPTEADGFGLFDPGAAHADHAAAGDRLRALDARPAGGVLRLLDELIEQHAEVEIEVERTGAARSACCSARPSTRASSRTTSALRRGETELEVPLLELWQRFAAELPADARDDDGLQILRAVLSCAAAHERHRWDERGKVAAELGVRHVGMVQEVLLLLLELAPDEQLLAGALDAAEADLAALGRARAARACGVALAPGYAVAADRALAGRAALRGRAYRSAAAPLAAGALAVRAARRQAGAHRPAYGGPHARHSDRMPNRPPIDVVVRAFEQGAATEADLVDQLVGPRGTYWNFSDLGQVSSLRRAEQVGAGSATLRRRRARAGSA